MEGTLPSGTILLKCFYTPPFSPKGTPLWRPRCSLTSPSNNFLLSMVETGFSGPPPYIGEYKCKEVLEAGKRALFFPYDS